MKRQRRPTLWRNAEDEPTKESIKQAFIRHMQSSLAKDEYSATNRDRFHALSLTIRDCLVERWVNTQQTYVAADAKRVYYLSLEYLMGRALRNAMINSGHFEDTHAAMTELNLAIEDLEDCGVDAGLGNGGLGRLAACFLDSMATMELPAYGYGLRYDFGIFRQAIRKGRQVEEPDEWLKHTYPWEFPRDEFRLTVQFGGRVESWDDGTDLRFRWVDTNDIHAMPYDTPIPGYGTNTVNTLRLWHAKATEDFDIADFNVGDYIGALENRVMTENITRVLYPNDNFYLGKELRLRQQYLLVSATLQDAIRRHLHKHKSLDNLADKAVFQLNDTHPALAVAEMMRLLIDEHRYDWAPAWEITTGCMAYTNHTLLPEALEKWSSELVGRLLPRHIQIIEEINRRFLAEVAERFPDDAELVSRVSLFEEGDKKRVRMANLAVVGSFSVNGVAALHTELLKTRVMPDFHRIWPEKFNNKTNGITQRRWLLSCNQPLAELISREIGEDWITSLDQLKKLNPLAEDQEFCAEFGRVKQVAKKHLADVLKKKFDFVANPEAIFDIQIKRIHEYKRQLLNLLHIVHLYCELRRNPQAIAVPRLFLIGGKAAPGYHRAKLFIKLTNDIAATIARDPQVREKLQLFFVPDYKVSLAEALFPGADVSEQISTAGFEASGTGNMKFTLNGALTLGTLDGANIEIAEEVGRDNIFIFGSTVNEVAALRSDGYRPRDHYEQNPRIREVLDLIASGHFNAAEPGLFRPIVDSLLDTDYYLLLEDFESYREAHLAIDKVYGDHNRWQKMALTNTANVGKFSSDRTIADYVRDIWKVESYPVFVE